MTSTNMKDFLKKDVLNFLTLGINAKEDFAKLFSLSLGISKVSLLIILIVVTVIYQTKYRDTKWSRTKLNDEHHAIKELISAGIVATFSIIPILFFYYSRLEAGESFLSKLGTKIPALLLIWVIIFAFDIAKESSGFNRYLSQEEIKLGHSEYNKISEDNIKLFDSNDLTTQGDPFINSFAWTAIYFTAIIIGYLMITMIIATIYGMASGKHGVNIGIFSKELTAMFIFNFLGTFISYYIKEDKIEGSLFSSTIMGTTGIIIHLACQFTGLYAEKE